MFETYQIRVAMSALGQKQTFAVQKNMSALLPKSGHMRCTSPCLLCAKSRHSAISLDHLIGASDECIGDGETEYSRGLEVDAEFDFRALLNRQFAGCFSPLH